MHEMSARLAEVAALGIRGADARDAERDLAEAPVMARLEALEAEPIGPGLAAALVELQQITVRCGLAVRVAALWSRFEAWTQAQCIRAWSDSLGSGDDDSDRLVTVELATALHVSEASASYQVCLVRHIGRSLDQAWGALAAGDITKAHVAALSEVTRNVPDTLARAVDERVVPQCVAARWTPAELKRAARLVVLAADPEGAAERAATAKRTSDVSYHGRDDEMATLIADGDAALLRRVMDAVDDHADRLRNDGHSGDRNDHQSPDGAGGGRTLGQWRVHALADLVLGSATASTEIVVTVPLDVLVGLTERPGELSGYGPITAESARALARDATLRRLVTDPLTGAALDLGRSSYRPSSALTRFLEARDRTCRFPGCQRRAARCDKDHTLSWLVGGRTDVDNLHCLCRKHHNLKTRRIWRVDVHPDGSETWTSSFGLVRRRPPPDHAITDLEPVDYEIAECTVDGQDGLPPVTTTNSDTRWWGVEEPRWIDPEFWDGVWNPTGYWAVPAAPAAVAA